jgi:uncharacterized protein
LPSSGDLLDANVWLALTAEAHIHHDRAQKYWYGEAAPLAAFCRVTQLALLRHLTNKSVMGKPVLTPVAAWEKCAEVLALPEVRLMAEPVGLDERLGTLCNVGRTSPNLWTDAYLAAFASCAGLRLVSFDQGFARFPGQDLLLLDG